MKLRNTTKAKLLLHHLYEDLEENPLVSSVFKNYYSSICNPKKTQRVVLKSDICKGHVILCITESLDSGIEGSLINRLAIRELNACIKSGVVSTEQIMRKIVKTFKNFHVSYGERIDCKLLILSYDIKEKTMEINTSGIPFTNLKNGGLTAYPTDYEKKISSDQYVENTDLYHFSPAEGDKFFLHTEGFLKKVRGVQSIKDDHEQLQKIGKSMSTMSFEDYVREINYAKKNNTNEDSFGMVTLFF